MQCIPESELSIAGTYSSNSGRMMLIMLQRCTVEDYCLDEQAAKNWLKGRFIVILANRKRFNPSKKN